VNQHKRADKECSQLFERSSLFFSEFERTCHSAVDIIFEYRNQRGCDTRVISDETTVEIYKIQRNLNIPKGFGL
jgi:hypothetical protein